MKKTSFSLLEKMILGLVLLLANLRALVFVFLFPDLTKPFGAAWIEIALWVFVAAGMIYLLSRDRQLQHYLSTWRRNCLLALFILLAILSLLWTIAPLPSFFRILELLFATVLAAYFGIKFLPEQIMDALFWFGAVVFILSIALVYGAPPTGTMYWEPFHGAWRGMYWHRNHLASITALLNAIYLLRVLIAIQNRNRKGYLDGFFYFVSVLVMVFARSATGFILLIVLNFFVLAAWLWLRFASRLKKWHYFLLLGLGTLGSALILSNLDLVFGLFNRNSTMTGRTGLWSPLLDIASQRLWLGHGFGAAWMLDPFREQVRQLVGWTSQPLIGDNGFIDILLHLGLIGIVLFTGVLVLLAIRGVRYVLAQRTLASFFPLLVLVYAIFGNISFSLFIETEVFVWFLIVASLFMTTILPEAKGVEIYRRDAHRPGGPVPGETAEI